MTKIDEVELGPAMEALTDRQRKFVRACIHLARDHGEVNYSQAARLAGYSDPGTSKISVQAKHLAHHPKIQAALLEESKKRLVVAAGLIALPVVAGIALNKKAKNSDRLRAALMLFERGGLPAMTEHRVTVEHHSSAKSLELAKRLAAELGVDVRKLIGVNREAAPVLDGEFTEVARGETVKAVAEEPERTAMDDKQVA